MQDIDFTHIPVNLCPRPGKVEPIPSEYKAPLQYFGWVAQRERSFASLIVNLYKPQIVGADMYNMMPYFSRETCVTLNDGMLILLSYSAYFESHELYGLPFVEALIKQYGFEEKRSWFNRFKSKAKK
uniref:hypothetical protein n=1 Tax=Thaumasiovibrio occultus TaxID=1891184 RepID=UPI000B34C669|nr:hypothetical protein [Thaumasiovibrio occultus]